MYFGETEIDSNSQHAREIGIQIIGRIAQMKKNLSTKLIEV